jgi:hypothetical protein
MEVQDSEVVADMVRKTLLYTDVVFRGRPGVSFDELAEIVRNFYRKSTTAN